MGDEERETGDADQQAVGVEQLEEGARVVAVEVERHPSDDVAQGDAGEQCRQQAAGKEAGVPDPRPGLVAVTELERTRRGRSGRTGRA